MVSDAAFLSEVEGFLASCGVPEFTPTRPERERAIKNFGGQFDKTTDGDTEDPNVHATKSKDSSYYCRRMRERMSLRQQVRDMTAELENLQKTKEAVRLSKWMARAKYRREERLQAEEKQRRLYAATATRATTIEDFFKLAQSHLCGVGGITEEETELVGSSADASHCGPFKRIRVDPPLDGISERYVNELNGVDKSSSEGESENEVWRDSEPWFDLSDNIETEECIIVVDTNKVNDNVVPFIVVRIL
ncbi:hypothetical protein GN244_ATG04621 [Phytophthora infestans]|uniref:Uncharacterized protein n=1 Tax=Phytophthora infestans TaxID=4787 RepID=A0A833WIM3_PHYIN|nr:hypothetical protein GN244_ATG04621 [Phytophthora infestans]KAF4130884.1 hypothetical protein GN958_ATG19889 [Phytophthora infestans]